MFRKCDVKTVKWEQWINTLYTTIMFGDKSRLDQLNIVNVINDNTYLINKLLGILNRT